MECPLFSCIPFLGQLVPTYWIGKVVLTEPAKLFWSVCSPPFLGITECVDVLLPYGVAAFSLDLSVDWSSCSGVGSFPTYETAFTSMANVGQGSVNRRPSPRPLAASVLWVKKKKWQRVEFNSNASHRHSDLLTDENVKKLLKLWFLFYLILLVPLKYN